MTKRSLNTHVVMSGSENVQTFVVLLSADYLKTTIFWDVTPCSPLKVNRRFGGKYLHLQGLISRTGYQRESGWQTDTYFHASILLGLFHPEERGDTSLRNIG
jgi:hypothetical protein